MDYQDRTIKCADCGKDFVFSKGEQEFFAQKGFTRDPIRCQDCRKAKKSKFSGPKPSKTPESHEMHTIKCKKCGQTTEVPFKPKFPDDILCSKCFEEK